MTAQVPNNEIGTASAGMKVADAERRNRKMTRITSATAISSVSSTSLTACRIEIERSIKTLISTGRYLSAQCRQFRQQGIDHGDGVGIRLLLNAQHDGTFVVQPA